MESFGVDRPNKHYQPVHAADRSALETAGNVCGRGGFLFGQMPDQLVERDDFSGTLHPFVLK